MTGVPPSKLPVGATRWLVSRPHRKDIANHITKVGNNEIGVSGVSYWMFTQRVKVLPTEAEVHAAFEENKGLPHLFAVWDFQFECGDIVEEKPKGKKIIGGPYPLKQKGKT